MFRSIEFRMIRGWAKARASILEAQIRGEIFPSGDEDTNRGELELCQSIEETAEGALNQYLSLDADHTGYLLGVCAGYMEHVNARCYDGEMSVDEVVAESYQIGYMQGRLEIGLITQKDLKVLSDWEEELE